MNDKTDMTLRDYFPKLLEALEEVTQECEDIRDVAQMMPTSLVTRQARAVLKDARTVKEGISNGI